ncbi:MAG TPA: leucyl/phenylalanyl-tRNA--protein transferase [Pyrinomonadaceae bacterium]|nr:leucyl/phenylalanyl-tRNA--protein transferase [Pyrinomonadaceae bacterium]
MSETETSIQHPAQFFKRDVRPINFPDPRDAPYGDIVAVGGNLHTLNLLRAYARGIFPWPIEGWPLTWFSPQERAVIDFKDLKIPRSLAKVRRRAPYRLTIDAAFRDVIHACARVKRADEQGTWITPEMFRAYCELHQLGHAHSVEAWEGDALVGGLYGVDAGGAFAGESMFYLRPNASKLALLHLIEHLRARGLDWLDIQVMTPHMQALGARIITRDEFLERLAAARARNLKLFGTEE